MGVVSMNECKDFTFPLTDNRLYFKRGSTHTWQALGACHKENKSPKRTTQ